MDGLVLESGIKKEVQLTPNAVREVKRLIAENPENAGKGLRLGVKGGGCAGFTYVLEFEQPQPDDLVYETEGIKILVSPMHQLYLAGTVIDFQAGLNNRGFIYQNPNADKTCGCGESFG